MKISYYNFKCLQPKHIDDSHQKAQGCNLSKHTQFNEQENQYVYLFAYQPTNILKAKAYAYAFQSTNKKTHIVYIRFILEQEQTAE
jgi:hypothetical protein